MAERIPKRITDALVRALPSPASGNRIYYDADGEKQKKLPGFGVRVTAAGVKSFILNYRVNGRERRYTIGGYGEYTVAHARKRADELREMVRRGEDPLAERVEARKAPTVADLAERFDEEHIATKRPSTAADYRALLKNDILPALKQMKVAAVSFSDISALHRKMTKRGASYRANRALAVMSKMFSLAINWHMRPDNPARGVARNTEYKRERYLSGDEMARLTDALAKHEDQDAAAAIRLLLLTGARRGEVLGMRWDQLDLTTGVWSKPAASTKQKTDHRVPLSAPARQLLSELRSKADKRAVHVFPGPGVTGHMVAIKKSWTTICRAADIKGLRLHDLRHSFASMLASGGQSLPIIGALLGHSEPSTTARYAHLFDDPLREAVERVGALVTGGKSADIMPFKRGA